MADPPNRVSDPTIASGDAPAPEAAAGDVQVVAPGAEAAGETVPQQPAPSSADSQRDGEGDVAQAAAASAGAAAFAGPDLGDGQSGPELASIDLLDDVELEVTVELGRAEMYIEDVLRLKVGSVVELDRLAGDPVDIFVNKRLVARGEVLVLNDNFCVRINDIVSPIPELVK
jgi:flagellar motor switch protein FliN/FliY